MSKHMTGLRALRARKEVLESELNKENRHLMEAVEKANYHTKEIEKISREVNEIAETIVYFEGVDG